MRLQRQLIPLGIVTTVIAVTAAPAGATVIEHTKYSFTESRSDVVCGVAVRHDDVFSGILRIRMGTGKMDSAFFGMDNYKQVTTLTNEANGQFVWIEHDAVWVDTTGTRI